MIEHIKPGSVFLDFITQNDNVCTIEGFLLPVNERDFTVDITAATSRGKFRAERNNRPTARVFKDGKKVVTFVLQAEVGKIDSLRFYAITESGDRHRLRVYTGRFTNISPLKYSYRSDGKVLIRNMDKKLDVRPLKKTRLILYEMCFWTRLLFHWRMPNVAFAIKGVFRSAEKRSYKKLIFEVAKPVLVIAESIVMIPRAFILRFAYYYLRSKSKRPIWIISDRGMAAGDNGEALYRYISQLQQVPADVYFVVSKKSKDYKRLKHLGKLLNQDSLKYKLYFLLANKIISSHADEEVTNPFLRQRYHFQDLIKHEFVFLQHGIIRHDHSSWLHKYEKNIKLFVTSAKKEYLSILEYDYYYDKDVVRLTGLPRFDYLENDPKNKIIVAPTYRRNLTRIPTDKNGARAYDSEFKNSEYFQTYHRLLTDKKLLEFLGQNDINMELYLHPNFAAQSIDFESSNTVKIMTYPYSYMDAFREGNLLITDYSSVSFDFAYLKKPLIYYQFDKEAFYDHSFAVQAEFFSDQKHGFGPVITKHGKLIDEIISIAQNNFSMDEKYAERTEGFFYQIDKQNSKRVYEAIIAMDS